MSVAELDLTVAPAPELNVDLVDGSVEFTVAAEPVELNVEFVGVPGQKGEKGDTNGHDHVQTVAAAVWSIAHNLGFRPTVSVCTDGGVGRLADVRHLSTINLEIHFKKPETGTAHLS